MTETINRITDMANASDFELKHTPNIEITGSDDNATIRVSMGLQGIAHPQTEEHYIEWIRVLCDGTEIGRMDFAPSEAPVAEFKLDCSGKVVVAQALCNLHGIWEAQA
ncbi:MAG TPA: desulfoferrodoxin [Coriobacteriia bacterium]|nr:desulfoferrodoxin [Coriobacteriia bacterium]